MITLLGEINKKNKLLPFANFVIENLLFQKPLQLGASKLDSW